MKVGSFARSERMAKWNEVLRIEEELDGRARFAGLGALPFARQRGIEGRCAGAVRPARFDFQPCQHNGSAPADGRPNGESRFIALNGGRRRRGFEENMAKILPVIMCGGSGTRVWPESRESRPKQFNSLIGERSTFQMIVDLLGDRAIFAEPLVVTNAHYRFLVAEQLEEIGAQGDDRARADAPRQRTGGRRRRDFGGALRSRRRSSPCSPPTTSSATASCSPGCAGKRASPPPPASSSPSGIKPDHPATGYGYIRAGDPIDAAGEARKVAAFVEKPDAAKAQRFVEDGYLWNSGNFVFRADVMLEELNRFEPEIASAAMGAVENARPDLGFQVLDADSFSKAPKKSIDYAVMERTDKAAVIAADVGWSDVGLWSTIWRLSERDANGNSLRGRAVALDCTQHAGSLERSADGGGRSRQRDRRDDAGRGPGRRREASRTRSSNWSISSRRTSTPRRPSTSAPTGRGAIIRGSTRARAIRSSASS